MTSNFGCIGLDTPQGDADFARLLERLYRDGVTEVLPDGSVRSVWTDASGARVQIVVSSTGALRDVLPSFDADPAAGSGATDVSIGAISVGGVAMAGEDVATMDVLDVEGETVTRLAAELEDRVHLRGGVTLHTARWAAVVFAHEIETYPDANAYDAAQPKGSIHFAPTHLLPYGLFSSDGSPPVATAEVAGTVRAAELRRNTLTGGSFLHVLIGSLGGDYSVVTEPVLLPDAPAEGSLLVVRGFVAGRLTDSSPPLPPAPQPRRAWRRR